MNRKFKFRVWNNHFKQWQEQNNSFGITLLGKVCYSDYEFAVCDYEGAEKDYIIQQFTGLLDKNGKEIYEGDIVKDLDEENGVIEFNNGSFIVKCSIIIPFWSVVEMNGIVLPRTLNPNTFEVIGNIFENPDLIK